jgi:hypothetical protein
MLTYDSPGEGCSSVAPMARLDSNPTRIQINPRLLKQSCTARCARSMAMLVPSTRLVYVADREADMLPLMLRAAHNRCLPNSEKLWPHATQGEPLGEIEFTLPVRPGAKARIVRQQLWVLRYQISNTWWPS